MKKPFYLLFFYIVATSSNAQNINYYPLNSNWEDDAHSDLSFLDSVVTNYRIFFSGEAHYMSNNGLRHFHLFTYLYHKANVRYLVMEGPPSYIYFFNQYVQQGNANLIKDLPMVQGYEEEMLKHLYLFNAQLPKNAKIKLMSMDGEAFFHLPKRYPAKEVIIDLLHNGKEVPQIIEDGVASILKFERTKNSGYPQFLKQERKQFNFIIDDLGKSIEQNENIYKDFFGEHYFEFLSIVSNRATLNRGDSEMADNFLNHVVPSNHRGNYFFINGTLHTRLTGYWLADQINQSNAFKNRCLNFVSHYRNGNYKFGNQGIFEFENSGVLSTPKKTKWFSSTKKMLKLVPFFDSLATSNTGIFDIKSSNWEKKGILEHVNYLIYIQNEKVQE